MQKSSRLEAHSTLAELLQELPAGLKELAREKPVNLLGIGAGIGWLSGSSLSESLAAGRNI